MCIYTAQTWGLISTYRKSSSSLQAPEKMAQTISLPALHRTQCLTSPTFRLPPLDGSLLVSEIFDWHYEHSPDHPMFRYDDAGTTKTLNWSDFIPAVHRASRFLLNAFNLSVLREPSDRPVIGILTNSGERSAALLWEYADGVFQIRLHTCRLKLVSFVLKLCLSWSLHEIQLLQLLTWWRRPVPSTC